MMLDSDIVAVSPSSVDHVLRQVRLLNTHNSKSSLNGKGFCRPLRVHEHRLVDVSYIKVAGTFFYRYGLLDGCGRSLAHWEIRERVTEPKVETMILRACECHPNARPGSFQTTGGHSSPRIFEGCIRICGMTHARTSP